MLSSVVVFRKHAKVRGVKSSVPQLSHGAILAFWKHQQFKLSHWKIVAPQEGVEPPAW